MKSKRILITLLLLGSFTVFSQKIGEDGTDQNLGRTAIQISDFNTPLLSGFYSGYNTNITGPDGLRWQHLLNLRHNNTNNNYQLQIRSSYDENDRLFFRKFAKALGSADPTWNEIATRGSNTFVGSQVINGGHMNTTLFLHAQNASEEQHADLSLWASEPGLTWQGVGIGNNIHNFKNNVAKLSLLNPARGGTYMRLYENSFNFGIISKDGTDKSMVNINESEFLSNRKITSSISSNEGGAITLYNGLKNSQKAAENWTIYNMTAGYNNSLQFWAYGNNGYDSGAKMILTDEGNLGIGKPTPSEKLEVTGNAKINGNVFVTGTKALAFSDYGGGFYMGDNTWIRTYGDKNFYHNTGIMRTDGTFQVGGNGDRFIVNTNGYVGIGTIDPKNKLSVEGTIWAKEVKVSLADTPTPDYVFQKYYTGKSDLKPTYTMPTLAEVAQYTKANNHLPNIPSAQEIKANGLELGKMNNLLLQKIEELTLYAIEQQKEIEALKKENKNYQNLAQRLEALEAKK